jgi:hypothetical protein
MRKLHYPKTYGSITKYYYLAMKIINRTLREFSPEEWAKEASQRKYRYMLIGAKLEVRTGDKSGDVLTIDAFGYLGKHFSKVAVGRRIKLYSRPQDRRSFVYKLVGE